jgi:hypothetical protein
MPPKLIYKSPLFGRGRDCNGKNESECGTFASTRCDSDITTKCDSHVFAHCQPQTHTLLIQFSVRLYLGKGGK